MKSFFFYYSFPFFKTILDDFMDFINSKNKFLTSPDGGERGNAFKTILKMEFRGFKHINIDGYFKVNNLTKMDLTEDYKEINQNYFKLKNNILIGQDSKKGVDYDFGIFRPKNK